MKWIISLITVLIALAIFFIWGIKYTGLYCSKEMAAKIQLRSLSDRVKEFRRDCNRLPTTEEGLNALIRNPDPEGCPKYQLGGYIEGGIVPINPWDQEIMYSSQGRTFKVYTYFENQLLIESYPSDVPKSLDQ